MRGVAMDGPPVAIDSTNFELDDRYCQELIEAREILNNTLIALDQQYKLVRELRQLVQTHNEEKVRELRRKIREIQSGTLTTWDGETLHYNRFTDTWDKSNARR